MCLGNGGLTIVNTMALSPTIILLTLVQMCTVVVVYVGTPATFQSKSWDLTATQIAGVAFIAFEISSKTI